MQSESPQLVRQLQYTTVYYDVNDRADEALGEATLPSGQQWHLLGEVHARDRRAQATKSPDTRGRAEGGQESIAQTHNRSSIGRGTGAMCIIPIAAFLRRLKNESMESNLPS